MSASWHAEIREIACLVEAYLGYFDVVLAGKTFRLTVSTVHPLTPADALVFLAAGVERLKRAWSCCHGHRTQHGTNGHFVVTPTQLKLKIFKSKQLNSNS